MSKNSRNMLDYSHYQVEDFVMDKSFRKWILESDVHSNLIWEAWLKDNASKADDVREAQRILLSMARHDFQVSTDLQDEIWNNIITSEDSIKTEPKVIPMGPHSVIGNYPDKKKYNFKKYWYSVAAAVLILIGVGVFYISSVEFDQEKEVALVTIEKQNPRGQKSTVFLPDGSKVFLNSESSLTYQSNYNESDRRVNLIGEAFFEVAKDPNRPFIVETKYLNTTALGTSFNVKTAGDQSCKVSLLTGKVKVELNGPISDKEILLPGEEINYRLGDKELEKKDFDIETAALWRKGIIYLEDTPFRESLELMENWYNVTFIIEGELPQGLQCTGRFENAYLSNVLSSLGYALDFEYEIEGKKVRLMFNSQNPSL
ncbi:MAG: FecR domain-containing protein [Cyclobacteriaceae bacterium]